MKRIKCFNYIFQLKEKWTMQREIFQRDYSNKEEGIDIIYTAVRKIK
jgi:hypothetical protein